MKENKVILNLNDLPKRGKQIDWKNTVGTILYFNYKDTKGSFKIIEYFIENKKPKFKVEYNNNTYILTSDQIIQGKIGRVFKFLTIEPKLKLGEIHNDLLLLDSFYKEFKCEDIRYKNNIKIEKVCYYKYKCLKCGFEGEISEKNLKLGQGCPVEAGKMVIIGVNDVLTTHPWIEKYVVDKEEILHLSAGSNKKIKFKCPDCGVEKVLQVNSLIRNGRFSCLCNTYSYPERFLNVLLNTIINNKYIWQYTKKNCTWCENKKYDFYFKMNEEEYIVEVHGIQHYNQTGFKKTIQEEQANDKYKYELATSNGIKPENYIVIDFRKSTLEWGKEHILNSRLNEIFDLSNIDWKALDELSQVSLYKECINLYNEGKTIIEISKVLKICKETVRKYLKLGNKNKLCSYNSKTNKKEKQPLRVYENDIFIEEFDSYKELSINSERIFGKHISVSNISDILKRNCLYKHKWRIEKITLND